MFILLTSVFHPTKKISSNRKSCFNYRVFHGFRFTQQDDYLYDNFVLFKIKRCFLRQLRQLCTLARALNLTAIGKFNLPKSGNTLYIPESNLIVRQILSQLSSIKVFQKYERFSENNDCQRNKLTYQRNDWIKKRKANFVRERNELML